MTGSKKVAVVGCGYWGRNLVRNFAALGALAMVCDADASARNLASQIAPDVEVTSRFDEVLASSVECIVVASPAETHYSLSRQALEAGKDTFVEKPLALTYEEGIQLVKLADERGRILMVGHVLEYHPAVSSLVDLVHSGELGTVHYIYSHRLSLGIVRREENILWSFAPHDIAVILRTMGEMPLEVVATGGAYLRPGIADVTVSSLLFKNDVRAHIHVSWLHPFKEQRFVVVGSHRMASYDDAAKRLVLYDQRVELGEETSVAVTGDSKEIAFPGDEPLLVECRALLKAIDSRQPPLTDGHSGLRVLKVLEAAQYSLKSNGQPVAMAPEKLDQVRA